MTPENPDILNAVLTASDAVRAVEKEAADLRERADALEARAREQLAAAIQGKANGTSAAAPAVEKPANGATPLGDRILALLSGGEARETEIAEKLGARSQNVARSLGVLHRTGMVQLKAGRGRIWRRA